MPSADCDRREELSKVGKRVTKKDENGNDIKKWARMHELRTNIIKRTGAKWDCIVNGKMMLGFKLNRKRLPE